MSKTDDTFLGRWSRKKLAPETVEPEVETSADAPAEAPVEESLSDEEILAKLELPDPDQLKDGDDFAAFMNTAVPDHLRRRALRKLWLSNPALANLDGLVDYGEDFTDAAMVPEVLNTAYKVGRGFLKDILEEEPDSDDPEALEDEIEGLAEAPEDEAIQDDPQDVEIADSFEMTQIETPKPVPRRRMVFSTN